MGGGSLNLEILRGGGLKRFWKSRWKGGSKNRAFCRGGVDFFWNNPLSRTWKTGLKSSFSLINRKFYQTVKIVKISRS